MLNGIKLRVIMLSATKLHSIMMLLCSVIVLSVIMLDYIELYDFKLSVTILNIVMLHCIMLNGIKRSVIMLNVGAEKESDLHSNLGKLMPCHLRRHNALVISQT
jgi:hypothetical protein